MAVMLRTVDITSESKTLSTNSECHDEIVFNLYTYLIEYYMSATSPVIKMINNRHDRKTMIQCHYDDLLKSEIFRQWTDELSILQD